MSNYVIKFSRGDRVKYISHLDFVRMFHRTVRRAELPFVFSQGFNPHPIMTVAVPLSVGVTADGEYMKVGFDTGLSEEEIRDKLNFALPEGFAVSAVKKAEGKEYDFNRIERAVYELDAEAQKPEAFDAEKFLAEEKVIVMKKSKSGEKETDIRPLIYSAERIADMSGNLALRVCLAAGNNATLKPETLVAAINKYTDTDIGFFMSHRVSLTDGEGKEII